jgi:uncharacterized protein
MYAAREGHMAIVQFLIEKGSSLNMQNLAGDTAMIWAACNGHKDIVKLLLDKGAEASITNTVKLIRCHLACACINDGHCIRS